MSLAVSCIVYRKQFLQSLQICGDIYIFYIILKGIDHPKSVIIYSPSCNFLQKTKEDNFG